MVIFIWVAGDPELIPADFDRDHQPNAGQIFSGPHVYVLGVKEEARMSTG